LINAALLRLTPEESDAEHYLLVLSLFLTVILPVSEEFYTILTVIPSPTPRHRAA